MSRLVVMVPDLPAPPAGAQAQPRLHWVMPRAGRKPGGDGHDTLSALPAADELVLVCPPRQVAWHRITLPRAPAARLQAALAGVLEERVLDDPADLMFAVAPGAKAGQPTWVATLDRHWVQGWLDALAATGRHVDALVPLLPPRERPAVHVFEREASGERATGPDRFWALAMDEQQAVCLPLSGSGTAERLLPWRAAPNVRLSASLEAQRFAARYFQRRVRAVSDRRVALAAARRGWQLLQFDVAPAWAGRRWWRHGRGQLARPVWRPALAAVAVVLAVNVLGLNLLAWRTRANLDDQRLAMAQLLREAHPGVRAVLDAPRQMAQETERLRAVRDVRRSAELPGLLRGVASAWPAGVPAPGGWHYLNDRLLLEESALTVAQAEVLRAGLRPGGWAIERRDGQWHVHRDVAVRAVPTRASGGPGDRPEGRP